METAIGIRANPNKITFCIICLNSETDIEIKIIDKIIIPKSLSVPEQLKFVRYTLSDIITENRISKACIRIAESTAQQTSIPRVYVEGIIQELIATSPINDYYVGQISSISSKLGISRRDFKPNADGQKTFLEIDNWKSYTVEERESIMSASSTINL